MNAFEVMFRMNPVFGITVVAVGVLVVCLFVKKYLTSNKETATPQEKCENSFPGLLKAMEMVARYAVVHSDFITQVYITAIPEMGHYRLQMISQFSLKAAAEEERECFEKYFQPTWTVIEDEGRLYLHKDIYPQYTNVDSENEELLTRYLGEVHPEWEYAGSKITFRYITKR